MSWLAFLGGVVVGVVLAVGLLMGCAYLMSEWLDAPQRED